MTGRPSCGATSRSPREPGLTCRWTGAPRWRSSSGSPVSTPSSGSSPPPRAPQGAMARSRVPALRGTLELSAHMTVRPGQLEGFKRQAAECIRLTREKDRCRFHTCRPVYRGLARIAATVRSVHPAPVRCGFRFGSAADGHGIPASLRARVMRATLCPASRWANIHRTTGAVTGSGSSRCARRPHAACALSGAVRHQPAGTRTAGGRPGTGPAPGSGQPSRCGPGSGSG